MKRAALLAVTLAFITLLTGCDNYTNMLEGMHAELPSPVIITAPPLPQAEQALPPTQQPLQPNQPTLPLQPSSPNPPATEQGEEPGQNEEEAITPAPTPSPRAARQRRRRRPAASTPPPSALTPPAISTPAELPSPMEEEQLKPPISSPVISEGALSFEAVGMEETQELVVRDEQGNSQTE